jgi:hypothetical protein
MGSSHGAASAEPACRRMPSVLRASMRPECATSSCAYLIVLPLRPGDGRRSPPNRPYIIFIIVGRRSRRRMPSALSGLRRSTRPRTSDRRWSFWKAERRGARSPRQGRAMRPPTQRVRDELEICSPSRAAILTGQYSHLNRRDDVQPVSDSSRQTARAPPADERVPTPA